MNNNNQNDWIYLATTRPNLQQAGVMSLIFSQVGEPSLKQQQEDFGVERLECLSVMKRTADNIDRCVNYLAANYSGLAFSVERQGKNPHDPIDFFGGASLELSEGLAEARQFGSDAYVSEVETIMKNAGWTLLL